VWHGGLRLGRGGGISYVRPVGVVYTKKESIETKNGQAGIEVIIELPPGRIYQSFHTRAVRA
jgi:hypothetical protein